MRNSYRAVLIVLITVVFGMQAVARAEQAKACEPSLLPPNVDVGSFGSIVSGVYERSATFRAQCDRIGGAGNLQVSLRLDGSMRQSCLAFTVIKRRGRELFASVHLPPNEGQLAELIGHEFEHILEQLEGRDLRMMSQMRGVGVHQVERDLFETDRAQRAGKIVADEVRGRRVPHPSTDMNTD